MPVMPVLRVYRACASPSIVLKPRPTKTRAHELIPGALTVKTASFDDCRPANPRGSWHFLQCTSSVGEHANNSKVLADPTSSYCTARNILSSLLSTSALYYLQAVGHACVPGIHGTHPLAPSRQSSASQTVVVGSHLAVFGRSLKTAAN